MAETNIDPTSAAYAAREGLLCAKVRWTRGPVVAGVLAVVALGGGIALAPHPTWIVVSTLIALLTMATLALRLLAMTATWWRDPTIAVPPDELARIDRTALPPYSVLVPLYREPEVVPDLRAALAALDYPPDRLDIQFLVEPDDDETIAALTHEPIPPHMRLTTAPTGMPRTKPRACNTGLAQATGEFLVIFDAEDRPEPDQLLKAVCAYRTLPPDVVCLQCRLDHYNSRQSLPSRWTAIDYLLWYRLIMPGLQTLRVPMPLGGTSNHFRIAALRDLGGWDPFNVTEDCDLGLRIARRGWRTRMLASTTWEEAVAEPRAWINQRSRWIKGYLQTWMVHARAQPLRAFGWRGFTGVALSTAGLVAALLVNPIAWITMILWLAIGWSVVDTRSALSIATLVIAVALLLANGVVVGIALLTCLRLDRRDLLGAAALTPVAWVLQSAAAWKAAWEYVVRPFHWQKTRHGQAVADVGTRRLRQGLASGLLAVVIAIGVLLLAGHRIGDDMARQAAARLPPPPPTQLPVRYAPLADDAIALVQADNPRRPKPWRVVEAPSAPPIRSEPMPALGATASFPTAPLELLSRQQRDLSAIAALACDVEVTATAPPDLRVAMHWRDEDGRWFQSVAEQRLVPGAWTRLEFILHDGSAWDGLDHQRGWHPDLLRRVSEVGFRFFSALAYDGPLTVANLRAIPLPAPELAERELVTATPVRAPATTAAVMTRWDLDLDLGRSWSNPFDPEVVRLDAEFTTPDGAVERIPGFYYQAYTRSLGSDGERLEATGAPHWRISHRPRQAGVHRWRVLLTESDGPEHELTTGRYTAVVGETAPHPGYIRRSADKPELFARSDGSFHYPIGHNLCHAIDLRPPVRYSFTTPPDHGSYTFDRYFARMAAAEMNLARIWLTPWSYGLEGNPDWQHFHGAGRYNLANAWKLDHLLDDGERLGIDVLLTITHMSEFQTAWGSAAWHDSALNRANGGCLTRPEDFFTSAKVLQLYRQRLRYLVARWGDRPNILAWEFFGEANLMPGFRAQDCARWHEELAHHLRELDLDRHLIFTHTHNWQEGNELWSLADIDCVQGNGYIRPPNVTTDHVRNFDRYLREVTHYGKPVLVAEYGGRSELGAPSEDYLRGQLHSGIWASFTSPFAGLALQWWWNFTDGADLYGHYRGLARFAAGIDRLTHDYWPVRSRIAAEDTILHVAGMQSADSGFYWIHHPNIFVAWDDVPTIGNATLRVSDLQPGRYQLECWHTLRGEILLTTIVELSGQNDLPLPAIERDLAVKLSRIADE